MTFSWISTEREKQVVKFNTLREDFAGQVFLLRHFSGVVGGTAEFGKNRTLS